ncbi:response regulator [Salinimicrobium soli]|uniref:response regulator n=2 Tax=Bacteria TaxID=2 RepID=UPI003AAF72ED
MSNNNLITTPLRILLVEDNEADVTMTLRTIRKIVAEPIIEVVDDLEKCRDKMISFVPDVVISDYNLPTCNGLEVMELVKEKDENVPFIFLTGTVDDEELAAHTILAGAWGYILKKHMDHLEARLRPLLKKVVFHMISQDELRERLRKNKVAINQINAYLDNLQTDNADQKENIKKIKKAIGNFRKHKEDDTQA